MIRALRNMDGVTTPLISRRLAALVGAYPSPRSMEDWRAWMSGRDNKVTLAPAGWTRAGRGRSPAPRPGPGR